MLLRQRPSPDLPWQKSNGSNYATEIESPNSNGAQQAPLLFTSP